VLLFTEEAHPVLFNSYAFLFCFAPIVYGMLFVLGRYSAKLGLLWLTFASLFFYGWWDIHNLPILAVSMGFNYIAGKSLSRCHAQGFIRWARFILTLALILNLTMLAYYKYAHFFINQWFAAMGVSVHLPAKDLPLGISFFTFVQIAYLVDAFRGEVLKYKPIEYSLFVTYFPHLIAGPILHHKDVIPLFNRKETYRAHSGSIALGLLIFAVGLFKKTVIADRIAPLVSPVFDDASGSSVAFFSAWTAAVAFFVQIYFDFSGYSDMAVGLSRTLGIRIPANFYSPYQAQSIIDFWRRWHMSLSRFLKDYLYIPLGGNRCGVKRRYVNLFITMVLGGLWHGVGWTFIVWGALHGVYLVVNHAWRNFRSTQVGHGSRYLKWISTLLSICLTQVCVIFAWVFFRAPDLHAALNICRGMLGFNGFTISPGFLEALPILGKLGVAGTGFFPVSFGYDITTVIPVMIGLAVAFLSPNILEMTRSFQPALGLPEKRMNDLLPVWQADWKLSSAWAVATGVILLIGLLHINNETVFLYFKF
jgi:alginate O-acetyltransferase complex protein AlgI